MKWEGKTSDGDDGDDAAENAKTTIFSVKTTFR